MGIVKVKNKVVLQSAAIFVLGCVIFLIGIQSPGIPYFDEVHYVPAAREILSGLPTTNPEHPPLAKALIALGIGMFGDDPLGWRVMSALFGAVSLTAMYLWAVALFENLAIARWVTAITAVNQILYVQARIAMLDVFATAFIILAMAAFSASWPARQQAKAKWFLLAMGACLGLATACKWSGIVAWFAVILSVSGIKLLQCWNTTFGGAKERDWYRPDLWQNLKWTDWLLCLGVVPFCIYYLSFIFLGPDHLLPQTFLASQITMARDNSTLAGSHPYMSNWMTWPIIHRPTWYFFVARDWGTASAEAQAVVCLGNPLIFWGGIAAMIVCCRDWIMRRDRTLFLILFAYGTLYLSWAIVPRQLDFFFYYLPGAMVLGPALAHVFTRPPLANRPWAREIFLTAAVAIFLWLLPISNAAFPVSGAGYFTRMLFSSWR